MSRDDKLATLRRQQLKNRKDVKELQITPTGQTFHDVMEDVVKEFKAAAKDGVQIKDLEVLAAHVGKIAELKDAVTELKTALKGFPAIPNEIKLATANEFLDAIKAIKLEPPVVNLPEQKDIEIPDNSPAIKHMGDALLQLATTIKASSQPASQRASDFVPFRRVIKKGNTYVFDDSAERGGASGGGVPTVQAGSLVAVPISNADGTDIGTSPRTILMDDFTTANVTYVGKAAPGSATSAASWQILKIDETGSYATFKYAAAGAFTQIFDNRVGLSYS